MAISNSAVYESIGRAVCASQTFEQMFVLAMRYSVKQSRAETVEEIVQFRLATASKQPAMALLKEVSGNSAVSPELADRISSYLEKRHRVVHRLGLETGWPGISDIDVMKQILELCTDVENESIELAAILSTLFETWVSKFPSLQRALEKGKASSEQGPNSAQ